MSDGIRTPEEHARDWRLAAREPAATRRLRVRPEGMDEMLLVADEEGAWWAVPARCRSCGAPLDASPEKEWQPAAEVACSACGARHGPAVDGCETLATLVVDDEIYLLSAG